MADRPTRTRNRPLAWAVYDLVFRPWMPRSIAYVATGSPVPGDGSYLAVGELEVRVADLLDQIRAITGEDAEESWGNK